MPSTTIQLVIFDWAGTTVDFGSCAPAKAFQQLFASHGIELTTATARGPMGTHKRDHLTALLSQPEVADAWQQRYQRSWTEQDIDTLYDQFTDHQLAAIAESTILVPDLLPTVAAVERMGAQIGTTTGYFHQAAQMVRELAAAQGYRPKINVCADEVSAGRPAPWMIYRAMEQAAVYPPHRVIHVGDTVADIQSGIAAGCWSIGVCDSSNETGLSPTEWSQLDTSAKRKRTEETAIRFQQAGCHAAIASIGHLPALLQWIAGLANPLPSQTKRFDWER